MLTTAVAVVVPAHDEQDLLPACLAALQVAASRPGLPPVRVVVVADACSDGTAALARAAGAEVLEVAVRSAGAARRAGLDLVVATVPGPPAQLWLATTDADSRVPGSWLVDQLALRRQGCDAVAGTVAVDDWTGHPPGVATRFAERYAWSGPEHPHVHGANLALSAQAYLDVGRLPPLALAEDHALVDALTARGLQVARSPLSPVTTSARAQARCEGGFGDLLLTLAED